jgi:hypothetical protein
MTSYVTPKKGVEFIFYIGLGSQANPNILQASATIAAGDFKVSIDGGALNNLATLPAVTPAASKMVKITLSTSEMNGDNITVICSDAAGAEWCDQIINIQTTARQIDDLAYPATSGRSMVVDANGLVDANAVKVGPTGSGTAQTARDLGGTLGVAGAGLTAVVWNAAWDAEVQSEVQDAIEANNLDHLIKIAVDTNFATTVHLDSVVGHLADAGGTATFDRTTDALEALQAEHDNTQTLVNTAINEITGVVEPDLDNIQTRIPAALTAGGNMKSDALALSGDTVAADNAESFFDGTGYAGTNNVIPIVTTLTQLTQAIADSLPADGSRPSIAQALLWLTRFMGERAVVGTTVTVFKEDGTTAAMVFTLDSSSPTSITRSS